MAAPMSLIRRRMSLTSVALCATLAGARAVPAQTEHRVGTVHLPTSCAPTVTPQFDRAVALLHSFEFGASIRGFDSVLATDSTCAMAWWGIALSRWTNPMVPNIRPTALLTSGRAAAEAATRHGARSPERERAYIAAVSELYGDADQRARVLAYERAMADLSARFPADTEAKIFHALALVGASLPTDKTYANQLRAGAMLESLYVVKPDHPGLAHYIIHSYDVAALAGRATAAALRYADIAPAAAHALHMPSHTFTRIGMWNESARTNLRSMEAAERDGSIAEALHAADYAVYADLQLHRDSAAHAIVQRLPTLAAKFDPTAVTGAAPGSAGVYALAAIPARVALERRAWASASALTVSPSGFPNADALTYFARALGAAHVGELKRARRDLDSLAALQARLVASRETYWAEQVAIQHLSAAAWLDFADGRRTAALSHLRDAADREAATEKAAVSPGPLVPARELLGEMLLAMRRPADALLEFRQSLTREPNRYQTLKGAADAARAAGNHDALREYTQALSRLSAH